MKVSIIQNVDGFLYDMDVSNFEKVEEYESLHPQKYSLLILYVSSSIPI